MTDGSFHDWATRWLAEDAGAYTGSEVPNPDRRIGRLIALWHEPIPDGWCRDDDPQLTDPAVRYRRHHRRDRPKAGSEHELEHEILIPDPLTTPTRCLDAWLIDGINAVPLARDKSGGRAGNIEADMLLLTQADTRTIASCLSKRKPSQTTLGTPLRKACDNSSSSRSARPPRTS